jgi:hypothetical protein
MRKAAAFTSANAAPTQVLTVRELVATDAEIWDTFVAASPQGNIFSEMLWLDLFGFSFRVFGCYRGAEMVGGAAVYEDAEGKNAIGTPPLTPFQGILFRDHAPMKPPAKESLEKKISTALIETLEQRYRSITLANHYTFGDVRPFYFHTYGQKNEYIVTVRYTHLVDLSDLERTWSKIDANTRYEIHKAEKRGSKVEESEDFAFFVGMHQRTFERQGVKRDIPEELLARLYSTLKRVGRCQLYLARNTKGAPTSGVLAIWDSKRAYYLLGASEPEHRNDGSASLTLWTVFKRMAKRGLREIDLVGCNSPRRGAFKAGFGGALKHYFLVSLRVEDRENPQP